MSIWDQLESLRRSIGGIASLPSLEDARSRINAMMPEPGADRSVWETLETLLHGSNVVPTTPTLEEARYRINALRQGDPVSGRGPGMGLLTPTPEDYLSASLDALSPGVPLAGMVSPIPKGAKSYISDWKWKPAGAVREAIGLQELPEHVRPFGAFMQDQVARAAAGEITPRDLIKSYTITRSSIQRKGRPVGVVPENIRWAGEGGKIRPEDAFAAWLMTDKGQKYLDAAEMGLIDGEAIDDAVSMIKPFGKDNDLRQALEWAAINLPGREAQQADVIARGGSGAKVRNEWLDAISDYHGIGAAKAGFYGSLLGYGDLPTLDARQLELHTPNPKVLKKFGARGGGIGASQAVNRLARRQSDMALEMPENLEPFRQHLTHHAVWDKTAGEQTTHEGLIRAMRAAGLGGMGLLGALAYTDPDTQYQYRDLL